MLAAPKLHFRTRDQLIKRAILTGFIACLPDLLVVRID